MNKAFILTSAIIMFILLVSCAGTPAVVETTGSGSPDSVETTDVVETDSGSQYVWKPATAIYKYVDGTVDKTIKHSYDDDGNLLKSVDTDSRGRILYEQIFEYREGYLVTETMSDQFEIVSITSYELDSAGLIEKQIKQDARGKVVSIRSFEYDGETLTSTTAGDGNGTPFLIIEYDYQDGILVFAEYKLPDGTTDGSFERVLEEGLVTREDTMRPDGSVTSSKLFKYDKDRIVEEAQYIGDLKFKSAEFAYDQNGNIINEVWSDQNGENYEIIERSWLQFEDRK
jgi:antitoxin component YwqK of YwqJK toxin-antitoxin module